MKLDDALKAITEGMAEIIKLEMSNTGSSIESTSARRSQIAIGLDRMIELETLWIEEAKKRFKP